MSKIFRSNSLLPSSQNRMVVKYITINTKYEVRLSQNLKQVLKKLKKCSFYKSVGLLSNISNVTERNEILQILYSVVTYVENNHNANLVKLWIDDIFIENVSKINSFLNQNVEKLDDQSYIIINLGFEYKLPSVKK